MQVIETDGIAHTAEYMASEVKSSLLKLQVSYDCNVAGVVCVSASNMVAMRNQLASEVRGMFVLHFLSLRRIVLSGLLVVGCQAHACNLLAQDVGSAFGKATIASVVNTCKTFRLTHALASGLRAMNVARPPLPCTTRWNSHIDTLLWYNKHWSYIAQVCDVLLATIYIFRLHR